MTATSLMAILLRFGDETDLRSARRGRDWSEGDRLKTFRMAVLNLTLG